MDQTVQDQPTTIQQNKAGGFLLDQLRPYAPGKIQTTFADDNYSSPALHPGFLSKNFPSLMLYSRIYVKTGAWILSKTNRGAFDDAAKCYASSMVADACERTGISLNIMGMDVLKNIGGPCVFVSNHMSTLETFLLPCILWPHLPITFVVKTDLVHMPLFGACMRAYDPVTVERTNPREDLATILHDGCERLGRGISVIVFPQSTRSLHFDPHKFNSIGVKLARKANVPVVPVAVKTDAWGQGEKFKEFGPIRPEKDVMIRFFPPIDIQGSGKEEQEDIMNVLGSHVAYWEKRQEAKDEGRPVPPVLGEECILPETSR